MIKIIYERQEYTVTVTGHAMYAEPGKDIVCAGVTALSEAMLQRVKGRTAWQPAYGYSQEKGIVRVRLHPKNEYSAAKASEMLETVCAGYRAIARDYPDFVKYEER